MSLLIPAYLYFGFLRHSFCLHRQLHLHTAESYSSTNFYFSSLHEDSRTELLLVTRQPCVHE